jgi:hypothetical protein
VGCFSRWVLAPILACSLIIGGCERNSSSGTAPHLASAYGDLAAYWQTVAESLKIDPEQGQVKEWRLTYDENGGVRELTLGVYVMLSPGVYDVYTVEERENGKASWRRVQSKTAIRIALVPARQFFDQLSRVGYRRLEADLGSTPPLSSWFTTISGTIRYGPPGNARALIDGQIVVADKDGFTLNGAQGSLYLYASGTSSLFREGSGTAGDSASTAPAPGLSPPVYIIPKAGCFPESPGQIGSWKCPD